MTSVDDILFSPIEEDKDQQVDFLIRPSSNTTISSYDWCPLTSRALQWLKTYYPGAWGAMVSGWCLNFTSHLPRTSIYRGLAAFDILEQDDYIFKKISR